jgi:hypothetical protein
MQHVVIFIVTSVLLLLLVVVVVVVVVYTALHFVTKSHVLTLQAASLLQPLQTNTPSPHTRARARDTHLNSYRGE